MPPGRPWDYDEEVGGSPKVDEGRFQSWYHGMAKKHGLSPNPDDPEHFYDYRAAFSAGAAPDASGHWPSKFKREGHPRLVIDGVDTRTGDPAAPWMQDEEVVGNFPGKNASIGQGKAPAWYEGAWESARNAIFGHPDREEAKAAGIGLQPTPAEMGEAALAGGSFFGGPMAGAAVGARVLGGMRGVPGVVGKAAGWAAAHPKTTLAAVNAAPSVAKGDVEGAAMMAGVGALEGTALGALVQGKDGVKGAVVEKLLESAKPAAKAAAKVPRPDPGKAAASAHAGLMAFAKEVAKKNPKVGEKIWMLLDDAGKPLRMLTPDEAGAAARRGQTTTWVKNLWR